MNVDSLFKVVANKLNDSEVRWWVDFGTLLGLIREGKRIEYDDDYDMGFFVEDAAKILEILLPLDDVLVCSNLYFKIKSGKSHVCLHPFISLNGKMWECEENWVLKLLNVGEYYLFPFIRSLPFFLQKKLIELNSNFRKKTYKGPLTDYHSFFTKDMDGVSVYVPSGYDNILKETYGDYMTPRRDVSTCYKGNKSLKEWRRRNEAKS